jgi:hypothetical protein
VRLLLLLGLIVTGGLAGWRMSGFWRGVTWTTVALVGSMMFRGGRVLVLPFLFMLILEFLYWLALPPADGEEPG